MSNGPARLYITKRTDTPFLVVYRDPTKREKSGRAKRISKWFTQREDAEQHRDQLNERLLVEGAAGLSFDAVQRADAIAARQILDRAGHSHVRLAHLAEQYAAEVPAAESKRHEIVPLVVEFIATKRDAEGKAERTVKNLENRILAWIDRARVTSVTDINTASVNELRSRPGVSLQTRRNDLNAVSSFCTWLFGEKRLLQYHPLRGVKRPRVDRATPKTWTTEECARVLKAAQQYLAGRWLGSVTALLYTGARPSELQETRFYYGRAPIAKIQGGKLRGRANRMLPLSTAAVAWMKAAGSPEQVSPLHQTARNRIAVLAGVQWSADVPRHTYISNRVAITQDDAKVALEAGTSREIIHGHYHRLTLPADAKRWAALRPAKR